MSDDEKPPIPENPPFILAEEVHLPDGSVRHDLHGPDCARTREVHAALRRGEVPPHPDSPRAVKCSPAMVNSNVYREGWSTIFGKKTAIGQA
jgi:hypothetical protein